MDSYTPIPILISTDKHTLAVTDRRRLLALLGAGTVTVGLAVFKDPDLTHAKKKKKGKKKKGKGGSGNNGGGGGGGGTSPADEAALLQSINNLRATKGLLAFERQGQLDAAAVIHSQDMANRGYFDHNSPPPNSTTPDQRIAATGYPIGAWAENIYKGSGPFSSAQDAFDSWVNSPKHFENMTSTDVTQIGIGVAVDGAGNAFWTNTFSKPA